VLFAEIPWTPGEISQGIARVHRIGQEHPTTAYFLVARDTVEEKLCSIVQHKQKVFDAVIDGKTSKQRASLSIYDELEKEMLKGKT
jgi:SNF2 family DNA or RNA helicase